MTQAAAVAPLAAVPPAPENTKGDPVATESPESLQQRYVAAMERLRAYKDSNKKSKEAIAAELGPQPGSGSNWSASTIGVFLNGSYSISSLGNILPAVERLLTSVEERQRLIVQPVFARTSVARSILTLIKRCQLFGKNGILGVEPGVGKTEALKHFALTNPTSMYIRANRTFSPTSSISRANSSALPTLRSLALALNIIGRDERNLQARSQTHLYDEIVMRLCGSRRVIAFDQAHWLPIEALDIFTTLNEDAGVSIIVAGHTGVYDRGPRDYESYVAYHRRALRIRILTSAITEADVRLIAEQVLEVEVARKASRRLHEEARKPGGLGWVVSLLQVAQTYSDGTVTLDHVEQAIKEVPPPVIVTGGAA